MKPALLLHNDVGSAMETAPAGFLRRLWWVLLLCTLVVPAHAGEISIAPDPIPATGTDLWHYGAYLDVGYVVNPNFPENHLWRNRATAARHNEFAPNMALAYVRKDATESSRWGMELGVQGGYDSERFAFLQGEREVGGADTLRHIHRANVSYLAPVGKGLTITAGLFNSLIGYESLYAKDNVNYTRSWIADNTPYMMFGVNAKYPVTDKLTVAGFIVNGYYHLSHPNDQPSYGGQWAYKATPQLTLTQTVYGGRIRPTRHCNSGASTRITSSNGKGRT